MKVEFWNRVRIWKREARTRFGRHVDRNRDEYVIKIPGWTGELRRRMTDEEASEYVNKKNSEAFHSAAAASSTGLSGYKKFCMYGTGKFAGMGHTMTQAAIRSFSKKKE